MEIVTGTSHGYINFLLLIKYFLCVFHNFPKQKMKIKCYKYFHIALEESIPRMYSIKHDIYSFFLKKIYPFPMKNRFQSWTKICINATYKVTLYGIAKPKRKKNEKSSIKPKESAQQNMDAIWSRLNRKKERTKEWTNTAIIFPFCWKCKPDIVPESKMVAHIF